MKAKQRIYTICLALLAVLCVSALLSACFLFDGGEEFTVRYTRGADDATGATPNLEFYKEGATVTLKAATTFAREGYTFVAWSCDGESYEAGSTFMMPAHDVTFTAEWSKDEDEPPEPPEIDTSTTVTATEVKFESGNLVFRGTAGGGVETLVAYLYDTNEGVDAYKANASINSNRTFSARIALSKLSADPGNWYYLMISVNGGEKVKVEYEKYDRNETYDYGNRRYKWEYHEGIAVNYVNISYNFDVSAVALRAGKDGHVYLSVTGNYQGYTEKDFALDMQLQGGSYLTYKTASTVTLDGDVFTVAMDVSGAAATGNGQFYIIHLTVGGASRNVGCASDPWIVETTATDDNKIFKLKSDYVGWGADAFVMKITVESQSGRLGAQDYLKVNGTDVRKNKGQGDVVMLRGTNVGGYFVSEQWMTAVDYKDYKTASEILANRFGQATMQELWAYYRSYFWTDNDFQNCADMGMTVLRLPFTYLNVDYAENGDYDFSALDDFVRGAAKHGIYTILDLHGAYGSQNGQDHSGEELDDVSQVDFYWNADKKAKTVALWKALAEHYKGNAAVAGFDVLNEPGLKGGLTSSLQWDFYDELYDAIREVDTDRIVIFESCWAGSDMPHPSQYGWENCMYSFHHYTNDENYDSHVGSFENRLREVNSRNFGIPVYMGEFSAYSNEASWVKTLALLEEYGWHWTSWTYKTNWSMGGWGIYYTSARNPDLYNDSIYDIKDKWRGTSGAYSNETAFGSGRKLKDIIKDALRG